MLIAVSAACTSHDILVPDPQPSAYWWQTTWNPDSIETEFIKAHDIKKIYMRFFDVTPAENSTVPTPVATIRFLAPTAGIKIIPTIFITASSLKLDIEKMPQMLAYRVLQMCETNDIKDVDEIQIDCDWTPSTEKQYFTFLTQLRDILHGKGMKLSATIRSHQMQYAPPPVDYGVLMLYNTELIAMTQRVNPVLTFNKKIKSYLKDINHYNLPLCVAYPNFGYQLLYKPNDEIRAILYNEDIADSSKYAKISDNEYLATSSRLEPTGAEPGSSITQIVAGDRLIIHNADYEEIKKAYEYLDDLRPLLSQQSIIYDINSRNINNLTSQQYEKILHH